MPMIPVVAAGRSLGHTTHLSVAAVRRHSSLRPGRFSPSATRATTTTARAGDARALRRPGPAATPPRPPPLSPAAFHSLAAGTRDIAVRSAAAAASTTRWLPQSTTTSRVLPPTLTAKRKHTTATTMAAPTVKQVEMDVDAILSGSKYPAKAHARRVAEYIRAKHPDVLQGGSGGNAIIYVEGRADALLEDCDEPVPFRQRRAFMYLTGASDLADAAYVYDIAGDKATLFIPPVDPEHVVWAGLPLSAEQAAAKYDVDEVLPTTELNPTLARLAKADPSATLLAIADRVADKVSLLEFGTKNMSVLGNAIDECRVVKDEYEIALIVKANQISGAAHRRVLEKVRRASNEYELQGAFLGECVSRGAKEQAYPCIVASGRDAATLHYVHNNKPLAGKELLLLDAGAEWECYASDIVGCRFFSFSFSSRSSDASIPVSKVAGTDPRAHPARPGRHEHFPSRANSPRARSIYDIVLKMQLDTTAALKAGVSWDSVHLLAHRVAIEGLQRLGIFRSGDGGYSVDDILEARTSAAFLPHGLGHYLGMDTHDTGGHPNYADTDPLFRYLRVRGDLPAGSVVTVEPGIYFCDFIIRPYLADPKHARFIDEAVLDQYWDVGGVRIEDNILITDEGSVNLTDAVKDAEEMERIISGGGDGGGN
ncbi:Xaa-Pro dipeptidase [Microdochium nivale]|nr:Xaa-Pro dipeptidase [Microdochium nivale]